MLRYRGLSRIPEALKRPTPKMTIPAALLSAASDTAFVWLSLESNPSVMKIAMF